MLPALTERHTTKNNPYVNPELFVRNTVYTYIIPLSPLCRWPSSPGVLPYW